MEYWLNLELENIKYIDSEGIEQEEVWKDLPECEGIYMVSNLGRLKSVKRPYINNGNISVRKGNIIKGYLHKTGYRCVNIVFYKNIAVHKLVAIAFLNHKQCFYEAVVDHIDENKLNNTLNNLRITTNRVNTMRGHKNTSSKYVGVSWVERNQKWCAMITIKFKAIFIGYFDDEEIAKKNYDKAFELRNTYSGNNKEFRNLIRNYV